MKKQRRKIYILLTKHPGKRAGFLRFATRSYYAHASIGLEEDLNTFYSFTTKGFVIEKISKFIKPDREPFPCQLYELEVSNRRYDEIKKHIEQFIKAKENLHYSKRGLALSILHIPYKPSGSGFYCTQFVAEILKRGGAKMLSEKRSRYFSRHLQSLPDVKLCFEGNFKTLLEYLKISPVTAQ